MAKHPDEEPGSGPPEYTVYGSGGSRRAQPPPASQRDSRRASQPDARRASQPDARRASQPDARRASQPDARRASQPDSRRASQRDPRRASQRDPYTLYRSAPRGLLARLRGESDPELELARAESMPERRPARTGPWWRRWTWKRAVGLVVLALVGWVALSFVLFLISSGEQPALPANAQATLTPAGNMLTSADTVLILGIDQRPRTGPGSKEPGADFNVAGSNSDTIMLWRVGGGVSRRLSIPRDTVANIPGYGPAKINDGFARGGPALAIKTIEQFTGLAINHVIIVNLGAFPPFIDAIGGVSVTTGKVCGEISGGAANGGFTLDLSPGTHHLDGIQALTYARLRENPCNPQDSDLTRVLHQQEILNAVRAQLLSPGTFFRLPWASWQAPKVLQTDMSGFTLMSLFIASEIGGNAPPTVLPTSSASSSTLGDVQEASPTAVKSAVSTLING